jgi:drug/metabolite transporter (DMT)-like permease
MLLFVILSVYAALLVALIIAAMVTTRKPGWQPVTRYLVAGTLGSVLGFIVANGCVVLAGVGPILLAGHYTLPQWVNYTGAVIVAGILFLGPILASVIGVIVGFAAGIYYVFKRRNKTPPPVAQITP